MTRYAYALGCAFTLSSLTGCGSADDPAGSSTSAAKPGSDSGTDATTDGSADGATDGATDGGSDGGTFSNPSCGTNGVINANIGARSIEIESELPANTTTCRGQTLANGAKYNANLHVGTATNPGLDEDPADDVPHDPAALDFDNCPAGAASSYIDWADLDKTQHSCNDLGANDTSAFSSGVCVATGSSPKKADITGVAFASNASKLYLGLTRKDNNGDVAFTYVFTKRAMIPTTCSGGFVPHYALQTGDIVLKGDYPQSSGATPVIDAWKYVGTPLDASSAVDPDALVKSLPASAASNSSWTNVSTTGAGGGIASAANIDYTLATDVLPTDSVGQVTIDAKTFLLDQIALEMAVPMTAIAGANFSVCNPGQFHLDVFSQSSSSVSSAFEDYIGGIFLNLGSLSATPAASASCDTATAGAQKLDLSVSALTGRDGSSVTKNADGSFTGYSCAWTCKSTGQTDRTLATCAGSLTGLAAGSWTCSVAVSETSGDQCSASFDATAVTINPRIGASPSITGSCSNSFDWSAGLDLTTGSGAFGCSWSFSSTPTGATLPGTAGVTTSCSGSNFSAGGPFATGGVAIGGTLTVTDSNTSCSRSFTPTSANVYSPPTLSVTAPTAPLARTSTPPLSSSNNSMSYTATVARGASPSVSWSNCSSTSGNTCSVSFADSTYCDDHTVTASVTDSACSTKLPPSISYKVTKTTTLTSSLQ
jgi:hypothetical protein